MAVKVGFEPTMERWPHTPLAGERLQPLGHFTVGAQYGRFSPYVKEFILNMEPKSYPQNKGVDFTRKLSGGPKSYPHIILPKIVY